MKIWNDLFVSFLSISRVFDKFLLFSRLKSNRSACETAGIGALKGLRLALCDMSCNNLNNEYVKIQGILKVIFDQLKMF